MNLLGSVKSDKEKLSYSHKQLTNKQKHQCIYTILIIISAYIILSSFVSTLHGGPWKLISSPLPLIISLTLIHVDIIA